MKKIVVFTGSGISAESGIKTFRDSGGLWEEYRIEDVATPEAWERNRTLVLEFYNLRRKQVLDAKPNAAHLALAKLQEKFSVHIITQNIDDLHERAGSEKVLHLHGEIRKSRSTLNPRLIYHIDGWELKDGDVCEMKSQLRPHIVWFGEMVPEMASAAHVLSSAELFIVIGTSLNVYPAAGLADAAPHGIPKFLIDPKANEINTVADFKIIADTAAKAVPKLVNELLKSK